MYITIAKRVSDFVFPAVVFNALHAYIHVCHLPQLDRLPLHEMLGSTIFGLFSFVTVNKA